MVYPTISAQQSTHPWSMSKTLDQSECKGLQEHSNLEPLGLRAFIANDPSVRQRPHDTTQSCFLLTRNLSFICICVQVYNYFCSILWVCRAGVECATNGFTEMCRIGETRLVDVDNRTYRHGICLLRFFFNVLIPWGNGGLELCLVHLRY